MLWANIILLQFEHIGKWLMLGNSEIWTCTVRVEGEGDDLTTMTHLYRRLWSLGNIPNWIAFWIVPGGIEPDSSEWLTRRLLQLTTKIFTKFGRPRSLPRLASTNFTTIGKKDLWRQLTTTMEFATTSFSAVHWSAVEGGRRTWKVSKERQQSIAILTIT